ncbi:MAG: TRAP transporter small permease [Rhodobacter sp.]|nr:TRAP transporter small permease [Rhodobacter sp.]
MHSQSIRLIDWTVPLAFILCAAVVVWSGPNYLISLGWADATIENRYPGAGIVQYAALIILPVLFVLGVATVKPAPMELDDLGGFARISLFLGRVTMLLIALLVGVMTFEVVLRYVFERPTLWANELSLWMAGFLFLFAGLYAMQQRSHIRIFLVYDLFPRWLQKVCDTFSTLLIVIFMLAMIWGGYGESSQQFFRWELLGTAFDPPIPATLSPAILIVISLVAIQAVSNLIEDWNKEKEVHAIVDDIDVDELTLGAVGDSIHEKKQDK